MKILYITHEYGDRWVKYAAFLRELGHDVDLIELIDKRTPGQVTREQFKLDYDIVWSFAADYIYFKVLTDTFIEAVKNSKSIFIGYCTMNTRFPFKEWVHNFKIFDLCFLHSRLVTEMAEKEGLRNVYHMPYGFDKDAYYPMKCRKKFNITFTGSPQTMVSPEEDNRAQTINALKSFNIHVFGGKFKGRLQKGIKIHSFSTHREMNKIYNQSKINLDIPWINTELPEFRDKYHPKNRFFDIPGSGNFLLCGYDDEANAQFQDGKHCLYYRSIDDLCEKIEYYLTHEKERDEITEAGYQYAIKNHQTIFRFKAMMDIIEERYF